MKSFDKFEAEDWVRPVPKPKDEEMKPRSVRLPEKIWALIDELVNSNRSPIYGAFPSISEFIRTIVSRAVYELSKKIGEPEARVAASERFVHEQQILQETTRRHVQVVAREGINSLCKGLMEAINLEGDLEWAVERLDIFLAEVENDPEEWVRRIWIRTLLEDPSWVFIQERVEGYSKLLKGMVETYGNAS